MEETTGDKVFSGCVFTFIISVLILGFLVYGLIAWIGLHFLTKYW